jgi:hypothetical protein
MKEQSQVEGAELESRRPLRLSLHVPVKQAYDDGPDRGEQEESGTFPDADASIFRPTIVAASEEARYPKLYA